MHIFRWDQKTPQAGCLVLISLTLGKITLMSNSKHGWPKKCNLRDFSSLLLHSENVKQGKENSAPSFCVKRIPEVEQVAEPPLNLLSPQLYIFKVHTSRDTRTAESGMPEEDAAQTSQQDPP